MTEINQDLVRMEEEKKNEPSKVSIFDTYAKSHKTSILLACAGIALLTPFTDTIYLPALTNVGETLHASDTDVALTVSTYMAAAAIGQICWGCFSDYYGRLITLYVGIVLYLVFTIACIFPENVETLIALRTLEGLVIGSTIVTVTAIIADVYEPAERGTAMGAFLTPLLVGPVIAPVIGGALSESFNWRATFVLLAVMTVPLAALSFYVLPETHHYFVVKRVAAKNAQYSGISTSEDAAEAKKTPTVSTATRSVELNVVIPAATAADDIEDGKDAAVGATSVPPSGYHHPNVVHLVEAEGMIREPMVMPWESLAFVVDPQLAPSFVLMCAFFSTMFTTLTSLPLYISQSPYNLNTTIIGILFLPSGIAMLIGSIVGGVVSDYSAAKYPKTPEGRLVCSIPFQALVPIGAVAFGFSLAYGTSLGYVLVSQSVLAFGQASLFPTMMGYLTTCRPKNASAVTSVLTFVCFAGGAVCITIAPIISSAIGLEYFYVIMASLCLLASIWSVYDFTHKAL